MYADYQFYKERYYGNAISEEDFPRLAERAADIISSATLGRADGNLSEKVSEKVKKLNCALAEVVQNQEKAEANAFSARGSVVSESVGSWSASYGTNATAAAQIGSISEQKNGVIAQYLAGTGLLYGGVW